MLAPALPRRVRPLRALASLALALACGLTTTLATTSSAHAADDEDADEASSRITTRVTAEGLVIAQVRVAASPAAVRVQLLGQEGVGDGPGDASKRPLPALLRGGHLTPGGEVSELVRERHAPALRRRPQLKAPLQDRPEVLPGALIAVADLDGGAQERQRARAPPRRRLLFVEGLSRQRLSQRVQPRALLCRIKPGQLDEVHRRLGGARLAQVLQQMEVAHVRVEQEILGVRHHTLKQADALERSTQGASPLAVGGGGPAGAVEASQRDEAAEAAERR